MPEETQKILPQSAATISPADLKRYADALRAILDTLHGRPVAAERLEALLQVPPGSHPRLMASAAYVVRKVVQQSRTLDALDWESFQTLNETIPPNENAVRLLLDYLADYGDLWRILRASALHKATAAQISEAAPVVEKSNQETAAQKMTAAKLASLTDRRYAAQLFQKAIASAPTFFEEIGVDRGSFTYFTEQDVESSNNILFTSRHDLGQVGDLSDLYCNLVFSCDTRFLRAHGTHWLNLVSYLSSVHIGMIFIVVGSPKDTHASIEDAKRMLAELSDFKGTRRPIAPIFIPHEVPQVVREPETYYACARYLFVETLLDRTNLPLAVVDIDMNMKDPPLQFLAKAFNFSFGASFTKGIQSLSPWKRYMAGITTFSNTSESRKVARDVARYIEHGLDRPNSWTLDQNALTFAVERVGVGAVADLSRWPRPVMQAQIRSVFERGF